MLFSNLQDLKDLRKHYELLEDINNKWARFIKGEISLADLKQLIKMKEKISDKNNQNSAAALELLILTRTAA